MRSPASQVMAASLDRIQCSADSDTEYLAELMGRPGTAVVLTLRRSLSQAARAEEASDDAASDNSSDLEEALDLWSYYQVSLVRGSAGV